MCFCQFWIRYVVYRNPKCSNVAKCSNYYILPCNCIDIYRQNVVIYYKTGYHFFDICNLNVVTWNYYNKDQVCMGNKIPNVVVPTITSINKEIILHTLGDDHLILRGGGGTFLTLKMMKINYLSCSGKKINIWPCTLKFLEFG